VVLVEVNEAFAIPSVLKPVASMDEIAAELAVVVEFAVDDGPDAAVLVVQRLTPAGRVDDHQPAMTQGRSPLVVLTDVVRAPMGQEAKHALEAVMLFGSQVFGGDDSGYAAHAFMFLGSASLEPDLYRQFVRYQTEAKGVRHR